MIRYVAITNVEAAYIRSLSNPSFRKIAWHRAERVHIMGYLVQFAQNVPTSKYHTIWAYIASHYLSSTDITGYFAAVKKSMERCSCRRFLDASKEYTELEFSVSLVTLGSNRTRLAFTNLVNVSYTKRWSNCFSEPAISGAKAPVKLCLTNSDLRIKTSLTTFVGHFTLFTGRSYFSIYYLGFLAWKSIKSDPIICFRPYY